MVAKARQDWIVWVAATAMVVSLGLHARRVVPLLHDQDTAPVVLHDKAAEVEPQIDMDSVRDSAIDDCAGLEPSSHPAGRSARRSRIPIQCDPVRRK